LGIAPSNGQTDDQRETIAFLSASSTHGGADVERIETHASIVFLAADRAWKLKRAVRYDFLDFSTASRRGTLSHAEFEINRRTAPELYLRVVPVTRAADGRLALGGPGAPVDWVIEMRRFDQEALFDRLAAGHALDLGLMAPLARAIARLHRGADVRRDQGGVAGMAWIVDGNAGDLGRASAGVIGQAACDQLHVETRAALDRTADRLEARRSAGFVRQCHGDLHLGNIVLFHGVPTLFDGIEFNDRLSCIDVAYDVAFLVMDLRKRGLMRHANSVWNAYLRETADFESATLLPLFLSCRAAVRAKTSLAAAELESDAARREVLHETAREYFRLAVEMIRPPAPLVIAIGGLSGSGKSVLAQALAPDTGPAPGAVILRSDEVRKSLFGVAPESRLGAEAYSDEVSRRVYGELAQRAAIVVSAGQAVIVDAVFLRSRDRTAIEDRARQIGVPFAGLWLDAPESVLAHRVTRREGDASDADASVVRAQIGKPVDSVAWTRIDAETTEDIVLARARTARRHLAAPKQVSSNQGIS
jgi:aminoglycoside phosphotransferase family enzyme/predicted kinase